MAVADFLNPDAYLCHYTRAEPAFSSILPSGTLKMNPYSKMRDPFESQRPTFRSAAGWGDDADAQNRMFWMLMHQVATARDDWRLLSLTRGDDRPSKELEKPFRCPWARPRLWEQYAENHAGVCLLFDREAMIEALTKSLGSKGQYERGEVEYTVGGFGLSDAATVTLNNFTEHGIESEVAMHVVKHSRDFFFLKTDDWASEWEYRFVFREAVGERGEPEHAAEAFYVDYRDALRYVLVGQRFPEWQIPAAREVAEQAGGELRVMSWEINRPWPNRL